MVADEKGALKHLPMDAYYNPDSITNLLSLKAINGIDGLFLTVNTKERPGIYAEDGRNKLLFKHSHNGLFHCTISDLKSFHQAHEDCKMAGFSLLSANRSSYTNDEVARAKEVRHLQECLMWPLDGAMKEILKHIS